MSNAFALKERFYDSEMDCLKIMVHNECSIIHLEFICVHRITFSKPVVLSYNHVFWQFIFYSYAKSKWMILWIYL